MNTTFLYSNLRTFRRIKNVKQAELAEKVGISPSYLSEIENCKHDASIQLISDLFEALNESLADQFKYFHDETSIYNSVFRKIH